jgi:hypothetical protein
MGASPTSGSMLDLWRPVVASVHDTGGAVLRIGSGPLAAANTTNEVRRSTN